MEIRGRTGSWKGFKTKKPKMSLFWNGFEPVRVWVSPAPPYHFKRELLLVVGYIKGGIGAMNLTTIGDEDLNTKTGEKLLRIMTNNGAKQKIMEEVETHTRGGSVRSHNAPLDIPESNDLSCLPRQLPRSNSFQVFWQLSERRRHLRQRTFRRKALPHGTTCS